MDKKFYLGGITGAAEKRCAAAVMGDIKKSLRQIFSLESGRASDQEIRTAIAEGANIRGSNMVILMTAILIASIGLNMNSTAVVIGAMLISPLMGGIMAIGFGMATADLKLVRKALAGLCIQVAICLLVSYLYFKLSPISAARAELLARTTPTIWDVLIAFFGGIAGIIGVTRKEKTNVIPGVAIATALMPPLCTAGYGIALGNTKFLVGAFYLFFINSFFICVSSYIVTRVLRISHPGYIDERLAKRLRRYFYIVGVITVIPSILLARLIVAENTLNKNFQRYMAAEFTFDGTQVVGSSLNKEKKEISVALVGKRIGESAAARLNSLLPKFDLPGYRLKLTQAENISALDQAEVQALIEQKLSAAESQIALGDRSREAEALKAEFIEHKAEPAKNETIPAVSYDTQAMARELKAIYPAVRTLSVAETDEAFAASNESKPVMIAVVGSAEPMTLHELSRIKVWIKEKTGAGSVQLYTRAAKGQP